MPERGFHMRNFHLLFLLFNMGLWNLLNFYGGLVFFAGFQRVQVTMPGLNHGLQVEAGSDSDSFWQLLEGVAVCGWPTYFLWELVTKQDSTSRSQWQQRKCFHLVVTFPGQGANTAWHSIFRQTATPLPPWRWTCIRRKTSSGSSSKCLTRGSMTGSCLQRTIGIR